MILPRLVAILLVALCCGCATRGDEFAKGERVDSGIRAEYVEQWRVALVDAVRLIYAGQVEQGRESVIDVTRSMYATAQTFTDAPSASTATDHESGARNWNAPAAEKAATEDNADVRGVLKKAQAAIAEMER